ncbi:MAG: hypothetical protein Q8N76_04085 [Candidatus Omnitrophota bacterium]|nr:hypothetical protein [Candidatus Omnitrophota bacterium]
MRKINKNIIITLIFMLIGGVYLALLCSNAYALRVPLNDNYAELDRAMLSNLTALELIERIYPDYERYIILLEGFCERIEGNKEISKADIEEYLRLKKKLGVILNIWNSKVADLWRNSKERGAGLTDDKGNKLFLEWKDSAMSGWLKGCDINIRFQFSPVMLRNLFLGPDYTSTNHFDIFVKANATDKFVFMQHIHANLTMRDLFTLIPLRDAELHIFCGSRSFTEEDPYRYYIENYGEIVMQIDENGLFSVPAVDALIAQIIGADELNDSVIRESI